MQRNSWVIGTFELVYSLDLEGVQSIPAATVVIGVPDHLGWVDIIWNRHSTEAFVHALDPSCPAPKGELSIGGQGVERLDLPFDLRIDLVRGRKQFLGRNERWFSAFQIDEGALIVPRWQ